MCEGVESAHKLPPTGPSQFGAALTVNLSDCGMAAPHRIEIFLTHVLILAGNALNSGAASQGELFFRFRYKRIMRMSPGQQKQHFILSLAQGGGVFCCLFGLPHAQAELKAFSCSFLRQACGQPEFTDVGKANNRALHRLISQSILPLQVRARQGWQSEDNAENDSTVITLS